MTHQSDWECGQQRAYRRDHKEEEPRKVEHIRVHPAGKHRILAGARLDTFKCGHHARSWHTASRVVHTPAVLVAVPVDAFVVCCWHVAVVLLAAFIMLTAARIAGGLATSVPHARAVIWARGRRRLDTAGPPGGGRSNKLAQLT